MKLSGHNWIGPQADRDCAESLRLSGKHLKSLSFCCFFLLPAGAGKAEPFRTAGGRAATLPPLFMPVRDGNLPIGGCVYLRDTLHGHIHV